MDIICSFKKSRTTHGDDMECTELIDLILQPHEVSAMFSDPLGQETHITVAVPDLRSARRSAWGDWGPMYTVFIPPGRTIHVTTRAAGSSSGSRVALDSSQFEVESPLLASAREITPLIANIPLRNRGSILRIFYDARGRAMRTALVPTGSAAQRGSSTQIRVATTTRHAAVATTDGGSPTGAGHVSE